jgi:hypothetical protein
MRILNQAEDIFPARFFASSGPAIARITSAEKRTGTTHMNLLNLHNKARIISLIVALIMSLGFLPMAHSVSPPPDGGYPDGNTAEGDDALLSLTNGSSNTAIGRL